MFISTYYSDRLNTVQIESKDALKVIERCDAPDSFFYIDPPYFNSKMAHYDGYSITHYKLLLEKLTTIKGKFILSSYPSEELSEYIHKNQWQSECVEMPIAVTKNTSKRKTEMMVFNFQKEIQL